MRGELSVRKPQDQARNTRDHLGSKLLPRHVLKEISSPTGALLRVDPLIVHFTHDYIQERFKDPEEDRAILDSVREVLEKRCQKESDPEGLGSLKVVMHEDRLYVAGSQNRRLCMWRLLRIFQPALVSTIKVRIVDKSTVSNWDSKLTTPCRGEWVEVKRADRGPSYFVGSKLIEPRAPPAKDSNGKMTWAIEQQGVIWPEARELLTRNLET